MNLLESAKISHSFSPNDSWSCKKYIKSSSFSNKSSNSTSNITVKNINSNGKIPSTTQTPIRYLFDYLYTYRNAVSKSMLMTSLNCDIYEFYKQDEVYIMISNLN